MFNVPSLDILRDVLCRAVEILRIYGELDGETYGTILKPPATIILEEKQTKKEERGKHKEDLRTVKEEEIW